MNKILWIGLLGMAYALTSLYGYEVFNITSIDIDDGGSTHTLTSLSTYNPVGDANVTSFTIDGTTTYSTSGFISGINVDSSQITAPGAIQPSNFIDALDPRFTDGDPNSQFYTGSNQLGSFLGHGTRGLSLSTGINVTSADADSSISFDVTILDSSLLMDGVPDFIFGDAANNQSADQVQFLDASDNVLLEFTLDPSPDTTSNGDWSFLGTRTIDRIEADGSAHRLDGDNQTLSVNMIAFSVEESDLTTFATTNFVDFAAAMAAVTSIEIDIPQAGNGDPKTDYAFIGVNLNAIDSPLAVVPEPSTLLMFGVGSLLILFLRKRT